MAGSHSAAGQPRARNGRFGRKATRRATFQQASAPVKPATSGPGPRRVTGGKLLQPWIDYNPHHVIDQLHEATQPLPSRWSALIHPVRWSAAKRRRDYLRRGLEDMFGRHDWKAIAEGTSDLERSMRSMLT